VRRVKPELKPELYPSDNLRDVRLTFSVLREITIQDDLLIYRQNELGGWDAVPYELTENGHKIVFESIALESIQTLGDFVFTIQD
jgi:hypothetical protein